MSPRFWSRDDLPDELKEMDPKDLVALVKKAKDSDATITNLQEEVKQAKTAFETFSNDFDSKLESKFTEFAGKFGKQPENNNNNNNNNNNEPRFTEFLVDPEKAMNERISVGLQPLAAITLQQASYTAKTSARERMQKLQRSNPGKVFDGYFFEKFESEIDALATKVPATQLANPETWEHLYYNVKGRHADEIAAQVKDGKAEFMIEPGTQPRGRESDGQSNDKLTDQELRVATKLGQTPEQFLAQKKKISSSSLGVNI